MGRAGNGSADIYWVDASFITACGPALIAENPWGYRADTVRANTPSLFPHTL